MAGELLQAPALGPVDDLLVGALDRDVHIAPVLDVLVAVDQVVHGPPDQLLHVEVRGVGGHHLALEARELDGLGDHVVGAVAVPGGVVQDDDAAGDLDLAGADEGVELGVQLLERPADDDGGVLLGRGQVLVLADGSYVEQLVGEVQGADQAVVLGLLAEVGLDRGLLEVLARRDGDAVLRGREGAD